MSKITSKLQITLPKVVAARFGLHPGDEIAWEVAGNAIRIVPRRKSPAFGTTARRLKLFDQATQRQSAREGRFDARSLRAVRSRGWSREDLYARDRSG